MRVVALRLCALVLALTLVATANAQTLSELFAEANRASARGDFDKAIGDYERVVDSGVDDPDLSFNLATTHAKAGHFAQAIRYFEHTLLLDPSDAAARRDLDKAQKALGQKLASKTGEAVVETRPPLTEALFAAFRAQTLALALLCAAWLLTLCLFALERTRGEATRLSLGIASALSVAVLAISTVGLGVKLDWGRPGQRALVIHDEAKLLEGPDQNAQVSKSLREGTPVRVLSREQSFVEVELTGARRGFLSAADVGEI